MTKLEKLYSIIENSREVGVKLTKEVLQQVEELEEGIIKEEILPALSGDIAPRLEPIRRDLVLVVEYHPGEPISVALSRKAKISEIMGAKTLIPRNSTPVKSEEKPEATPTHEPTKHVENTTKGLRVTFPDGTVIWHQAAINTFIETLRKIGLERIPEVGIIRSGYNIVSKDKRPPVPGRIWQHECDGWYIYSNMSNSTKVDDLKLISEHYKLGLIIEEGKPTGDSNTQVSTIAQDVSSPSGAILITSQNVQEVQGRDMRITVNGKVFQERNAIQTFIEALKFIGLDEVAKVGIMCSGYNLVDTRQRLDGGRRWQQQEGDKWVYVYFSNSTKAQYLFQIADSLKVNIKIEAF
jgi:endonuclease V-like protein UPF0215 family